VQHLLSQERIFNLDHDNKKALFQFSLINSDWILTFDSYDEYVNALHNEGIMHFYNRTVLVYNGGVHNYYINGSLHREDGPAILMHWYREYWLHGKFLFDHEWLDQNNLPHPTDLKTILKYKKLLMLE